VVRRGSAGQSDPQPQWPVVLDRALMPPQAQAMTGSAKPGAGPRNKAGVVSGLSGGTLLGIMKAGAGSTGHVLSGGLVRRV
jgi:hypothetical protein